MCDLVHTWEKVKRRGGFYKFRCARSPVSRSIDRGSTSGLLAHALLRFGRGVHDRVEPLRSNGL